MNFTNNLKGGPAMSTEGNKALARRTYEIFNRAIKSGDFSALDDVISAAAVDHNPEPGQAPGLEGVKQIFAAFRAAFPDLHFTVEDMIAEGDKVVSRLTSHATHRGDF